MTTAATTRAYAYAEFDHDTPDYDGVRITLADKIALERSARANRWTPLEEHPSTVSAFLAWTAGKRAGLHNLTYDAFLASVIDAGVTEDEPADGDPDTGDELDPTRTDPGTASP